MGMRPAELMSAAAGDSGSDARSHVPGELGVWMFILGDMLMFGLFFVVFMQARAADPALFLHAQAGLNLHLGAVNTLLLLTSSWFVVKGLQAARTQGRHLSARWFVVAIMCGVGFASIKLVEYSEKIGAGITLTTNDFYMYYFIFTGIHFMHVLIGMGVLVFMWLRVRTAEPAGGEITLLESGATFWHLVDLLWIVLFPLLYLVR